MSKKTNWYKEAVVYQIYPMSFKDSDKDGIGDIPGIISKLDYIKDLGVTAIWFSPLYPSPWKDCGYDVSDYKGIHPAFGSMEDFNRLMDECRRRDIRVIMDMVLNHTSTQHEWFKAAMADPDSPYRDYYIIRKGRKKTRKNRRDGSVTEEMLPPNNWVSSFSGPAWDRIGDTDEYYMHLFAPEQADLNWENPKVREEIIDILKFWLDKGVDGFRFDVFNLYSKAEPMKNDINPFRLQKGVPSFVDGPKMHEYLAELNEKALSLYDSYSVGESYIPDETHAHRYVKEESGELDSIFDFEHLTADNLFGLKLIPKKFNLPQFKKGLIEPQLKYHGNAWNTLVLENHDTNRSVSRFSINTSKFRYEAATFLPLVTFMGWGTPFIFQGEEIGMTNSRFATLQDFKDPVSHFLYDWLRRLHFPHSAVMAMLRFGARDNTRTPMQWDGSLNAGFSDGDEAAKAPWMDVNPDYTEINVEKDLASPRSIYAFYQKVIALKKSEPVLLYGDTIEYYPSDRQIIAYSRSYEGKRFLIAGNFSGRKCRFKLPPDFEAEELVVRLGNYERTCAEREMMLKPYEALLFEERR